MIIALSAQDKVCKRLVFSRDRPTLVSNVELSFLSTEPVVVLKIENLESKSITGRN